MKSYFVPGAKVQGSSALAIMKFTFGGGEGGWMRERSMPVTWVCGNFSANSRAQIPVPVPISRIVLGEGGRGER